MPCILCGPTCPLDRTGDSAGSTATVSTAGLLAFNTLDNPLIVPPVPASRQMPDTMPPVWHAGIKGGCSGWVCRAYVSANKSIWCAIGLLLSLCLKINKAMIRVDTAQMLATDPYTHAERGFSPSLSALYDRCLSKVPFEIAGHSMTSAVC